MARNLLLTDKVSARQLDPRPTNAEIARHFILRREDQFIFPYRSPDRGPLRLYQGYRS